MRVKYVSINLFRKKNQNNLKESNERPRKYILNVLGNTKKYIITTSDLPVRRLIAYFEVESSPMKKINLFILLFLIGSGALAQSDYLVTTKSDTIKGDLRILSYDQLDRVQITNNGKKEIYTAMQVLILKKDEGFYKPVQIDQSIRLMKIIKGGYLSLYGYKLPNQSTFDGRYLVKLNGSTMEVPNLAFKKMMANYLEDCHELSIKLKQGDLGRGDIEKIVEEYNLCMAKEKPAVAQQESIASPESLNKTKQKEAIQNLKSKIKEQTFSGKDDALDILSDIESKVDRNENVSNYLLGGLQSALKDQAALSEDLENLIALFKK